MAKPNWKQTRIRLCPEEYQKLLQMVFERDGYRCVRCKNPEALHGHHVIFRSQMGGDTEDNIVSLCWKCHEIVHGNKQLRLALYETLRVMGRISQG